jgi:streptogramin lyase
VAAVCPDPRTYTLNADFEEGTLVNVNHDIPNQLQLSLTTTTFPFVWVAASARGTIVKIHTKTGAIVGEYLTSPDGMGRDPSRTTVDLLGNCWVANRAEFSFCAGVEKGSVARVGQIIGGTRVNGDGSLNPVGDYLAPPFAYNTCIDRDGDGLIKTSRGLGDIRPWTNAGGVDSCPGGVATAEDECIINYTRVTGTGTRTIAVDANNDVWVGGLNNREHEQLDGITGQPILGTQFNLGCGGYGGFVDRFGVLWSARELLRYDPSIPSGVCYPNDRGDYGLGYDTNTCNIWHSSLFSSGVDGPCCRLYELDAAGNVVNSYLQPFPAQGVAVGGNSHVWMAEIFGDEVWHLAPDGFGGHLSVGIVGGFNGTTGVAVDENGKIWVTEINANRASRIDPSLGGVGGGGYTIGAIDLQVDIGAGAFPYNYSDMTGRVGLSAALSGTWTVVRDGAKDDTEWGTVTWNTEDCAAPHEPPGTSLTVEVRAANTQAGLSSASFVEVENGVKFNGVLGRFIEIRVEFTGATPAGCENPLTPVLCDLSVTPQCAPPEEEGIPTVSTWGLVVLTLLLLTGWKVYFGRRHAAAPM